MSSDAKSTAAPASYPAFLEVKNEQGEIVFLPTKDVLGDPALQERCVDRKRLRRILRHELLRAGGLK